jgi:type I restriction enzyme S subunit
MYGATIGKVGILGRAASTNQAICGITPKQDLMLPEFLMYFLLSKRDYFKQIAFGGAQPNISQKIVRQLEVPLFSLDEQEEILHVIKQSLESIDSIEDRVNFGLSRINKLENSIIIEAFKGSIFTTKPQSEEPSTDGSIKQTNIDEFC